MQDIRSVVLFPRDLTQEERVAAALENDTVLVYPDDDTRYALAPLIAHQVMHAATVTTPYVNTLF